MSGSRSPQPPSTVSQPQADHPLSDHPQSNTGQHRQRDEVEARTPPSRASLLVFLVLLVVCGAGLAAWGVFPSSALFTGQP